VFDIYPNPVIDNITIKTSVNDIADIEISIVNISGDIVYHELLKAQKGEITHKIDLSSLSAGTYIINLMNKGVNESERFVVMD
jgi:hypothetical protein